MKDLQWITEDVEQFSDVIAAAIIKRTQPVRDDLSESEARKAYGTRWLAGKVRDGLAHFSRIGNKKVFSRHQLDCLRLAERQCARLTLSRSRKDLHRDAGPV